MCLNHLNSSINAVTHHRLKLHTGTHIQAYRLAYTVECLQNISPYRHGKILLHLAIHQLHHLQKTSLPLQMCELASHCILCRYCLVSYSALLSKLDSRIICPRWQKGEVSFNSNLSQPLWQQPQRMNAEGSPDFKY